MNKVFSAIFMTSIKEQREPVGSFRVAVGNTYFFVNIKRLNNVHICASDFSNLLSNSLCGTSTREVGHKNLVPG